MRILVTGATGFVGRELVLRLLADQQFLVRASIRRSSGDTPAEVERVFVGELSSEANWTHALDGMHIVVHAAARVHRIETASSSSWKEFYHANVDGTLALAVQAANQGVRRFIYLSSIKVNGEKTELDRPFLPDDVPKPTDPYGMSKWEAEQGLKRISANTGMQVVIIRPPLVYGPGVKANFLSMMRWLQRGCPLPLAAVTSNKRSLVAVDNLVDFIVTCLQHPAAPGQTLLVSDYEDLSTAELLTRMAAALGRPARLFAVPPEVLLSSLRLLGFGGVAQRLLGSLQVDIKRTRELLNWCPPVSVDKALERTARHFLALRET